MSLAPIVVDYSKDPAVLRIKAQPLDTHHIPGAERANASLQCPRCGYVSRSTVDAYVHDVVHRARK